MQDIPLKKYYAQKFVQGQFVSQAMFSQHSFACKCHYTPTHPHPHPHPQPRTHPHTHTHTLFTSRGNEAYLKNAHVQRFNFADMSALSKGGCSFQTISASVGHTVDFIFLAAITPVLNASEISVPFSCVIESWQLTLLAYYIKSLQEELTRQEAVLAWEDLEAQHLCRDKSCYYYLKCMIFPRSAQI